MCHLPAENIMSTHQVNLDALIPREDFETKTEGTFHGRRLANELKVEDLERAYKELLRKPDFQRETANWSPEKIVDFIRSFLDGDLIPATIMWWSSDSGTVFVIDGAHRLSALKGWVHDDYGDRAISLPFFGHNIPPAQKRLAEETRRLVDAEIGAYQRLKYVAANPDKTPDALYLRRARNIGTFKIDLQWVEGNAPAAERSFFKINTGSSVIDPTELGILRARRKPNAIATRALMRAGTGHKYWAGFDETTRERIETLAREIDENLFKPLLEVPIRTLDLPIAGQAYSADGFKMIFDLVNLANGVTPAMWEDPPEGRKKRPQIAPLPDDSNGATTIEFLHKVKKAALRISGDYSGSLGLHPVVYFYGATGRFQPPAFLAAVKFVEELDHVPNGFFDFTKHRRVFEEYLVRHRHFANQLTHALGSRTRPLERLVLLYHLILDELKAGRSTDDELFARIASEPRLGDLKKIPEEPDPTKRRRFTGDVKSAAFIRDAIDSPLRCTICGARLHRGAISSDHKVRQQDGGVGDVENLQHAHPYCNTGYKEALTHAAKVADSKS